MYFSDLFSEAELVVVLLQTAVINSIKDIYVHLRPQFLYVQVSYL